MSGWFFKTISDMSKFIYINSQSASILWKSSLLGPNAMSLAL